MVSDSLRSASSTLLDRLYDLEQSHAALSDTSQDGAIDSALLRAYYLDVARAVRAVQGMGLDEQDNVTRALLDLTQQVLQRADDAHRQWSGGANVTDKL
jgi:hypothetical protein